MDDDAKHHDFDQRHDGPFDQPEPRASIQLPPVATSSPVVQTPATDGARSPLSPVGRKSLNWQDTGSPSGGRKSMQGARPSRDFDVRRDGPYGRPSITMSRRRSSGMQQLGNDELPSRDQEGNPIAPDLADIEGQTPDRANTGFEPEPPRLDYDMWSRKWFILFFWSMVLVDCVATPIILYFCLHYLTDLSNNLVFTVVTAALGGVSIFEYFVRAWRLWRKDSTCRVAGESRWGRWAFDWFHWNFTLGWVAVMIELIMYVAYSNLFVRRRILTDTLAVERYRRIHQSVSWPCLSPACSLSLLASCSSLTHCASSKFPRPSECLPFPRALSCVPRFTR